MSWLWQTAVSAVVGTAVLIYGSSSQEILEITVHILHTGVSIMIGIR
ncbi:MAG: hypothetical protein GWP17_03535 [Aquificales bacterium]|nr:hypothetical protein [Aquificales bacterium]